MHVTHHIILGHIEEIEKVIGKLTPVDIPPLLGDLARLTAQAQAQMMAPLVSVLESPLPPKEDKLLNVAEASAKLGWSKDQLYRHSARYPFTVRSGGRLQFSLLGIEKWIKAQTQKMIA